MKKGLIVAITGQSGSGKSSVGKMYAQQGYTVVDCDRVAAEISGESECQNKLTEHFGRSILKEGIIDKKELSRLAFKDTQSLEALTEITHPFIIEKILKLVQDSFSKGEKVVFVDGAVIIGHSFEKYCDKIIVVTASLENQCNRLIIRDNITKSQAENRIFKQLSGEQMLAKADYVLHNNFTQESLMAQAQEVLHKILQT
ncbi:MAG: dephospho-CoA kinase [Oscillospiraceae bacterium]